MAKKALSFRPPSEQRLWAGNVSAYWPLVTLGDMVLPGVCPALFFSAGVHVAKALAQVSRMFSFPDCAHAQTPRGTRHVVLPCFHCMRQYLLSKGVQGL